MVCREFVLGLRGFGLGCYFGLMIAFVGIDCCFDCLWEGGVAVTKLALLMGFACCWDSFCDGSLRYFGLCWLCCCDSLL